MTLFAPLTYNRIKFMRLLAKSYSYKTVKRPDMSKLKLPVNAQGPGVLDILKDKVRLSGPITVADYFNTVVTNPVEGYYVKKEVIGQGGDFITSPEISQLFGELLAVWFMSEYKKMGSPKPLQLVELGPGNATLLVDVLRVINRLGLKPADLSLHLVEISPTLQNIQANKLCISHQSSGESEPHYYKGETIGGSSIYWYNDISKVPKGFSWFIAHEFFDALPIHKFRKTKEGWREILIDMNADGELSYKISSKPTKASEMFVRAPLDDRATDDLEVSPRSLTIASDLSKRIDQDGGIALIADYGHSGEKGDTFRAFRRHELVDPLSDPGRSDLTADVDFSQLRLAASTAGSLCYGPVEQGRFLEECGADVRLEVLIKNAASDETRTTLRQNYEMLTSDAQMGSRFKFMSLFPSAMREIHDKYPPIGFGKPAIID